MQGRQTELNNVEVKSARGGTPQRLYESLSAFANRTGGGVLLFGLNEKSNFEVIGVGNAQRLQEEISHLAASEMEPALRPEFTVDEIDGETVAAVEVGEVSTAQKPCYYKPAGLQKGSYIRVANTNRQMTDYEVFGYVSARSQPRFDEETIADASMKDLIDNVAVFAYVAQLQRNRPKAKYLDGPREEIMTRLRIASQVEGVIHPTLAGLLVFGKYPQEFVPQLVVTFLQYYGVTEAEKGPGGERFLDNRKFEGPIPEMVTEAINHVHASIRKSSLIEGASAARHPRVPGGSDPRGHPERRGPPGLQPLRPWQLHPGSPVRRPA